MTIKRRSLVALAALSPIMNWSKVMAASDDSDRLMLTDFTLKEPYYIGASSWRGFSDRVMGGISDAAFGGDNIAGKKCGRMTGDVTRESNGGFIQMAMSFGRRDAELDASGYDGLELLVYGNNEDYNLHIRTVDCGWYDQSYRMTFFAKPEWQTVRVPWDEFNPSGLEAPLNIARINRIAILGWMREFKADISLAEISLYRQ
ncbi:MAG: hypothetical protein ACI80M_000149 [Gammaproteobacteria bacterium]|jgi:hypothetical protein|tara:strand:+ start:1732 stop:2337 length:606 start_codon:yes stop_codon:yes gene_type:complete